MNDIRVCMLVGSYAPDPEGGAERQCRRLARVLLKNNCKVDVIAVRQTLQTRRAEHDEGVSVLRLGLLGPAATAFRSSLERYLFRIIQSFNRWPSNVAEGKARACAFWIALPVVWLARLCFIIEIWRETGSLHGNYDVLHVHESGWLAGIGVALGRRLGLPVICKEATSPALGVIGYDTPLRYKLDKLRRKADMWLAQTSNNAKELSKSGIPADRINVIPNGVTIPSEMADPARSSGVLYVGNLTQGAIWKAFDVLFSAWIKVVRDYPDAHLTIVGGGDAEPWKVMLRTAGVESSVSFAGWKNDVSDMYRSSGIFLLPSRVEGMSNALLEAQSWGLACVVSNIAGNTAVVQDGENGVVVPVEDTERLTQAVLQLLRQPELRAKYGRNAREKVKVEYSVQSVAGRVVRIYQSVSSRKTV